MPFHTVPPIHPWIHQKEPLDRQGRQSEPTIVRTSFSNAWQHLIFQIKTGYVLGDKDSGMGSRYWMGSCFE
jgi:hypothetical protein